MALKHRLRSLDRLLHAVACTRCLGQGKHVSTSMFEGDPVPDLPPGSGCPDCGRANRMFIMFCDERLPGVPYTPERMRPNCTAQELSELLSCRRDSPID